MADDMLTDDEKAFFTLALVEQCVRNTGLEDVNRRRLIARHNARPFLVGDVICREHGRLRSRYEVAA